MSIPYFSDNAIFMRNWRERMRLPVVASYIIISVIVISLIILACYLNRDSIDEYDYVNKTRVAVHWLHMAFFIIAIFQGIVLP